MKFKLHQKVRVKKEILKTIKKDSLFFNSYQRLVKGEWEIISMFGKHNNPNAKRLNCFSECWPIAFINDKYLLKYE